MVAQLTKTIKPKKLRIDKIRQNLLDALRDEGRIIASEFEKTTATWEGERPNFEFLVDASGSTAIVIIGPTGTEKAVNKWVWLDQGTRPHRIRARNKPRLVFKAGYSPKTKVGTLSSSPGGSFGPTVSKFEVQHPGTEARGWSVLVVKRRRKRFTRNIVIAARLVY